MSGRQLLILAVIAAGALPAAAQQFETGEVVMYVHGSGAGSLEALALHIDAIDLIAPQAYGVNADGIVRGHVDSSVVALAAANGVPLMPLIHNPGFNQEQVHGLLDDASSRAKVIESMVQLGREHGYWGWQFDFENIHLAYRDRLTAFYRACADALHDAGMKISIAVVPTDGSGGASSFARYMQDDWRGSFDVAALDSIGDFISLMTYAQHGTVTAPGPIGGLPWMRRMLDHALSEGVSPSRVSLGIPFYSGWWRPTYDERGARMVGSEIPFRRAEELLASGDAWPVWLPDEGVFMASWESEGTFQWLFLENERSLRAKLGLMDAYPGLRGLSIWVLGAEDPDVWDVLRR